MTREEALTELSDMTDAGTFPLLSSDELGRLLDAAARASVWTAETAYVYGQRVVPSTGNGRLYKCVQGGSSAPESPPWTGCLIEDGSAIWLDDGPAFANLWDLGAAAQMGWLRKAAQAAGAHDFKDGDQSFTRSQIHEACLKMAALYGPAVVF